jgi:hypothetical protein
MVEATDVHWFILKSNCQMSALAADLYRRRAGEYRTLAARASAENKRDGLLSVCELLEHLARNEDAGRRKKRDERPAPSGGMAIGC